MELEEKGFVLTKQQELADSQERQKQADFEHNDETQKMLEERKERQKKHELFKLKKQ